MSGLTHFPAVGAKATRSSGVRAAGQGRPPAPSSAWLIGFVLLLIAFQLALLFLNSLALVLGGTGPLRIVLRTAPYLASLALLFLLPRRRQRHPAAGLAFWAVILVAISILHPTTNTLLAGTAHAALYLAIIAPLFWVPRVHLDAAAFRRLILIFWGFYTLGAVVGVLQVFFPGYLQPSLSSVIAESAGLEDYYMTTTSGERVFRPMGLTDTPGGAAGAGFYAVLFGMGWLLTARRAWMRVAAVGSMGAGMMVIYLSQMRSVLVIAGVCALVFVAILAWRRELAKVGTIVVVLGGVALGGLVLAVSLGGSAVTDRLATLVADDAGEVYYNNRGSFLEYTWDELLPRYPFGAGLGRHGMMNRYFGDNSDPDRSSIWVEVQWTGWLLDGGIPLILTYTGAILLALWAAWRIARRRTLGDEDLPFWAALLVAYNMSALALTFSSPLFMGQGGMEFWLLNAALVAAASGQSRLAPALNRLTK